MSLRLDGRSEPAPPAGHGWAAGEKAVLVLGGYRQSLAVVRALGPLGWRCVLGLPGTRPKSFVARSRWVSEVWEHPPLDLAVEAFLAELFRFVQSRPDVAFLLPVGNREISTIDGVRDRLPREIRCVMPNAQAIGICGDKGAMLRLATDLKIPVAPFKLVEAASVPAQRARADAQAVRADAQAVRADAQAVRAAAQELGYPCVIRSTLESNRIADLKAFIAGSERDVAGLLDNCGGLQGPVVVQRYVAGERHCLYFYASRGLVLAVAQVRIHRTDRADGTGYAVAGSSVAVAPLWREHLQRICERLRYQGFGCLQFIHDPETGAQTFLEINARLGGNHAGLERLGMHQVRWAIDELVSGRPGVPVAFTYPEGRAYRWFDGDLQGLIREWRAARLTARTAAAWCLALPTTLVGTGHLVWDWRDPAPALHLARTRLQPAYRRLRAATARGRRHLTGSPLASRGRRREAWQRLLAAAAAEGVNPARLDRVYDYLSVTSKVRSPAYACTNQRPGRYFPGLAAKPWHDPADFPWRCALEDDFVAIRDEVRRARAAARFRPHHQNLTDQGAWNTLYFYSGKRRVAWGIEYCPKIARTLVDLPRAGNDGQAYLSVLSGRTHIGAHCGPTNVRLRCHFAIEVPDACCIRVGSEIVRWQEGRCLFFDDSFEHEVWNFDDRERIVLIVDVWHPDLTREERWALERLSAESAAVKHYQRAVTADGASSSR